MIDGALGFIVWFWLVFIVWVVLATVFESNYVSEPFFTVTQTGRNYMADILTYVINAAPPVDGDVVQREMLVTISGDTNSATTTVWPGHAVDLGAVSAPQDSNITISLVDVDDAGNRSLPYVLSFVAADTIPPAAPGAVTVTLVGETTQPDNNA